MTKRYRSYMSGLFTGLALAAAVPLLAQVSGSGLPYTFSAGTTASADQVNANFQALADDNDALRTRVEDLEVFVANLRTHLSVTTDAQGSPAIVISGANLQVNNGSGATDSVNGTGNVVIGYDESRAAGTGFAPVCSRGRYTTQSTCVDNGGVWALNHKSGSHNLVVGSAHNYSRYGGLVVGESNTINGGFASVSGGRRNIASRTHTSVSGGWQNTASQLDASVSGGRGNVAAGAYASVGGGYLNIASGLASHVSGGRDGATFGDYSTIVGGQNGSTNGDYSVVTGGDSVIASGSHTVAP